MKYWLLIYIPAYSLRILYEGKPVQTDHLECEPVDEHFSASRSQGYSPALHKPLEPLVVFCSTPKHSLLFSKQHAYLIPHCSNQTGQHKSSHLFPCFVLCFLAPPKTYLHHTITSWKTHISLKTTLKEPKSVSNSRASALVESSYAPDILCTR